ncbi:unnamed protein product [Jaminaea pallidilutea]
MPPSSSSGSSSQPYAYWNPLGIGTSVSGAGPALTSNSHQYNGVPYSHNAMSMMGGPSGLSPSYQPSSGSAAMPHFTNASSALNQEPLIRSPEQSEDPNDSTNSSKKRKFPATTGNAADGESDEASPHSKSRHGAVNNGTMGSGGSDDSPVRDDIGRALGQGSADNPKRIKTARACDSCRRKKIRCDVVDDGDPPPGDPNNGNGGLTCAHCRQYGQNHNCTFFLPITETRFKKKREREAEEAAARNAAAASAGGFGGPSGAGSMGRGGLDSPYGSGPSSMISNSQLGPPALPNMVSAAQEWPPQRNHVQRFQQSKWAQGEHGMVSPKSTSMPPSTRGAAGKEAETSSSSGPSTENEAPPDDIRVMGPTSLAYIVHSTAFIPGSAIEAHDLKHSQTFEVGASGDGIIKLNRLRPRNPSSASSGEEDEGVQNIPDTIRGRLAGDVAEKLINSYFEKIGYLFPIITKSEFLHLSRPPPLLFYAICGAAALDRNVPREVLSAVRIGLNAIFKDSDILSVSSANTVKALLILSLHGDIHGSNNVQSGSRMWNRLGVALRMAQDLGLHRDASGRDDLDEYAHFLEQKRRIWGACVTADRLVSVALGHPLAIDLTDCDVRLPSPYEVLRYPTDLPTLPGEERPFGFNTEMLKLSILFGRVQKTIYSPTGLMKASDMEITGLLADIDQWREGLPESLRFNGPSSNPSAGILHLAFSCIQMLFFRVFMRISYSCPQHLKFSLTIERMTSLIRWSRESIDWVEKSGALYLDTMQFVSYALVFCATVQYHSWVRRGDEEGLKALNKLKTVVASNQSEAEAKRDLSLRAKTAETIGLLHEAASGQWAHTASAGNLNPTAGVVNRRTADSVKGIIWRDAPGRPGGGAYEAQEPHLLLSDLPPGTIILSSNRTPALVRSANGWQQVPGSLPEHGSMSSSRRGERGADGGADAKKGVSAHGGNASIDSDSSSSNLPDVSNFTHLGGSVWQDEMGRPVDRRGSGLMVVLPQQMMSPNSAANNNMGGLDFANLTSSNQIPFWNFGSSGALSGMGGTGGGSDGHSSGAGNGQNFNPLLNGNIGHSAASNGLPTFADVNGGDLNKHSNAGLSMGALNAGIGVSGMNGANMMDDSGRMTANGGDPNNAAPSSGNTAASSLGTGFDPMMLNDPLMGMLDWQAWQTYLAPFSGNQQQQQQNSGTGTPSNNVNGRPAAQDNGNSGASRRTTSQASA